MWKRNALLVAVAAVLAVIGVFSSPDRARADVGVAGRSGGGFGVAGVAGGLTGTFGNAGPAGRIGYGGGGIGGSFRLGVGTFGRSGAYHGPRGHKGPGALLGNRFLAYQRARVAGRPLPAFVPLGTAELVAQRRRLNAKYLGGDALRRFHHRRGRCCVGPVYYPWALGVPGNGVPPVIIVQVTAPPAAAEPVAQPAEPDQGLDPRGRIKVVATEEQATDDWAPGDVLPDETPQVTLDHAAYGLPVPPLGEKYARIGNDVLRIDAGTRRITEVIAR